MHPIKFLFDDIHRDWGLPRDRRAKAGADRDRHRRRYPDLGALLLWR